MATNTQQNQILLNQQQNKLNQQQKMNQIKENNIIKCIGQKQSIFLCTNEECKHPNVFICGTKNCKCKTQHNQCLKSDIPFILSQIKNKIHKTSQFKTYVDKIIDKIIDDISSMREILLLKIQQEMKFTLLYDVQKNFLKIIQQGNYINQLQKFTSYDSALLWKIANRKFQVKNNIFDDSKKLIQKYQEDSKKIIQNLTKQIDELAKKQILPVIELNNHEKLISKQLLQKSSICKDSQLAQRLIKFFPKKLKKVELLYKASQHNFSLAKYYDLCGSATNTMVLVLTNKDKIIGGYTPLHFYNNGTAQWVADPSYQSFTFSLTNNE